MKTKIFAGMITFGVMLMLIISGPVNAFDLELTANKHTVTKGSSIKFTVSVDIKSNERLNIDYLKLIINGPTSKTCKFSVDGEKISGCSGITKIELISNTATYGYGYGYGWGYTDGKLVYKITLDTDKYSKGDYETKLEISVDGKTTLQDGPDFKIKKKSKKKAIISKIEGIQKELGLNLLELKEGEEYNFSYNSIPNKLMINKIEETDISLSINGISFEIALGETKQIDLDSDGINDMEIKSLFIGDKIGTILYKGLTGTIVFKEKQERGLIELTKGVKYTPPKKEELPEKSSKVDYQLNNFAIIWLLVLVNLVMVELVGIVNVSKK